MLSSTRCFRVRSASPGTSSVTWRKLVSIWNRTCPGSLRGIFFALTFQFARSTDVLRRHADVSHPRLVESGIKQLLFLGRKVVGSLFLKHAERVDVMLGHVEVDHRFAASDGQITQRKERLGND